MNMLNEKYGDLTPIGKVAKEIKFTDVFCFVCGESGKMSEENAYGKRIICKKCKAARDIAEQNAKVEEYKKAERERESNLLGGYRAYNEFTLERYDRSEIIKKCSDYPNINLFLWGSAGVGKTHLAAALVRNRKDHRVVKPQDIFRTMRGCLEVDEEETRRDEFIGCSHLVIDDMGTEKRTDFSYSVIYEIIDGRYMRESGGLIITSNLSLDDLAARVGDDRLTSRIAGMCKIIEITGKDRRLG